MSDDEGLSRWATLGLAGLLGLCCVSIPALLGAAGVTGGAAGATAVATGITTARALAVSVIVTAVTLVPIYLVWRWRVR